MAKSDWSLTIATMRNKQFGLENEILCVHFLLDENKITTDFFYLYTSLWNNYIHSCVNKSRRFPSSNFIVFLSDFCISIRFLLRFFNYYLITRLKDPLRGSKTYFRYIGTEIRTWDIQMDMGHMDGHGTYGRTSTNKKSF